MRAFMRWSRRTPTLSSGIDLDGVLFYLWDSERRTRHAVTLRQALEHILILGGTGSGKTSGSGRVIAFAFLRHLFGGLVHTVKPEELLLWANFNAHLAPLGYCAVCGLKPADVIVVGPRLKLYGELGLTVPDGGHCLSVLDAEFRFQEQTDPLSAASSVAYIACNATQTSGDTRAHIEPYWTDAVLQLCVFAVELCICARGRVRLDDICEIIRTAPRTREQAWSAQWRAKSPFWNNYVLPAIRRTPAGALRHRDLEQALNYWLCELALLAEKTRSVVESSFMSKLTPLLRGSLRSIFAGDRPDTFALEESHHGKVIIIDLPVKLFGTTGAIGQNLFKTAWQRCTERRNPRAPGSRCSFLWVDESQFLITPHDAIFAATARDQLAASVFLTQNISNYYAAMTGADSRATTDSLLGNFQTIIFHSQGDPATCEWAERHFAKELRLLKSAGLTSAEVASRGSQESLQPTILAREFTTLRKGGPASQGIIDAIVFQTGRSWDRQGSNYARVEFVQHGA